MRNGQIFPGNLQDLNPELVPYMADTGRNHIGDVVLQMQDVSVWHQDEQHPVIDHVNLTLRQGGSYAILGESGSGKSTLFVSFSTTTSSFITYAVAISVFSISSF